MLELQIRTLFPFIHWRFAIALFWAHKKFLSVFPVFSQLHILYTVDLDVKKAKKRLQFKDHNTTTSGKLLVREHTCSELQLFTLVGDVGQTHYRKKG